MLAFTVNLAANPFAARKSKMAISKPTRSFIMTSQMVECQNRLRTKLAKVMNKIKTEADAGSYLVLISLAFLYGLFHAAGPGHRKAVVFSAFVSKKAHPWEPAILGLILALLHAFASVLMILLIIFFVGGVKMIMINEVTVHIEVISYAILALFSFSLLIYKIRSLIKHKEKQHSHLIQKKGIYSTIILSGIIPCPGATLIMIFALSLSMFWPGIFAVIAMSLGMGITIAIAGYLAYFGKEAIFKLLKEKEGRIEFLSNILEAGGLLLILLFALFMLAPMIKLI